MGAVAIGDVIAPLRIESTSVSAQTNVPTTFGHAFKQGDLPASGAAILLRAADNSIVPAQLDVRAQHGDGSVRHAVISAIIPALGAAQSNPYDLVRTEPAQASPALVSDFPGLAAVVTIVDGGNSYTISLATLLAGTKTSWLSGDVVSEWEVWGIPKTVANVEHPNLHARFCVRGYKGQGKARVDITIDNDWAYDPNPRDVTYDVNITVGGASVYSKTGLVHFHHARWRRTFWWGAAAPAVHVKPDLAYLTSTKAIPNYDTTVTPSAANIATMKGYIAAAGEPMGPGCAIASMPAPGGRIDIGLLPGWAVLYLLDRGKDSYEVVTRQGEQAASWPMHYRDKNTGRVVSLTDYPHYSTTGSAGDNINPATGLSEKPPGGTGASASTLVPEIPHHPDQSYIPYLITGDVFHLEELQFWAMFCIVAQNSNAIRRDGRKGLLRDEQVRGIAWALRSIAHAAYISPPSIIKDDLNYVLQSNINFFDARYTNNTGDEAKLGIFTHDGAVIYAGRTGIANWQEDHGAAALGRMVELGFEYARPLFNWKSKWTIDRLSTSGTSWIQAAAFAVRVRDTEFAPLYTSYKECFDKTMTPDVLAAVAGGHIADQTMATAWGSYNAYRETLPNGGGYLYMDGVSNPIVGDMDGYSDSVTGYPSCLQQAVAYALTHNVPGAQEAWETFDSRTIKPNYSTEPQLALIPRQPEELSVAAPPDIYTITSGSAMYFGMAPPAPPQEADTFDSITFSNDIDGNGEDGAPWDAQNGKVMVVGLHGSSGANGSIGRQYRAQVSGYMALPGHAVFSFGLIAGWNGSEYHIRLEPVDFWPKAGGGFAESMHIGFLLDDGKVHLISERRYDAMLDWADANLTMYDLNRRCLTGGSMGGWGSISYGVRRHSKFAAIYPDRPRWRYGYNVGEVAIATLGGFTSAPVGSAPMLAPEDGGGSYAAYVDMIAYVSNPANKVRPILWCCGRGDGFVPFSEQCDAVDAMRAAGRAFTFVWNDGNHATGSIMNQILDSYPYGTYARDKGYPLFTEHSLDKNPRVDLVGEINGGLNFKNVVETASSWSCEVTSLRGACTVKVKPISEVFTANAAAQLVTIPAAGTYVLVTFTA